MLTVIAETLLWAMEYPIDNGTLDFRSAYFYVQPVTVFFLVPWLLRWLNYLGCFDCNVAWAYSLSGRGSIRFTVDSGATRHCVGESSKLVGFRPFNGSLKVADRRVLQVTGIGKLIIKVKSGPKHVNLLMKDVWYVPGLKENLFSVRMHKSLGAGNGVGFGEEDCIKISEGDKVPLKEQRNGHYTFIGVPATQDDLIGEACSGIAIVERAPRSAAAKKHREKVPAELWHCRFGHMNPTTISKMNELGLVKGMCEISDWSRGPCNICAQTKLKPAGRKFIGELRASAPLEMIHVDNVEGFKCKSFGNKSGYLFVDDYSRAFFFYPVKRKSEFLSCLQQLVTKLTQAKRFMSNW